MTVNPNIKSIAVIGCGPSGAGALKAFLAEGTFDRVKAFERRSDFGGLWNYTTETDIGAVPIPNTDPTIDLKAKLCKQTNKYVWPAAVYDYLDTNVPRDIMSYAEFPFDDSLPLFPHREDVRKYLNNYSEELKPYVAFNTKVVDVDYVDGKWQVTSRPVSIETEGGLKRSEDEGLEDTVETFDAILLSVGNYDLPYIPEKDGIEEWIAKYPGSIIHTKDYRSPQQVCGMVSKEGNILVVGNSASAGDLCFQIATQEKRLVYKSIRSKSKHPAGTSELTREVGDIEKFDADSKSVHIKNGTIIENVELIIFATGYLKSYPFLNKNVTAKFPLLTDGLRVLNVYEHIFPFYYPNLAILGLGRFVLPTRTSETQGCYVSKVWSGKLTLPPVEDMIKWEKDRVAIKGPGKAFHDLPFPDDVNYSQNLNQQIIAAGGGLVPHVWTAKEIIIRALMVQVKVGYIKYKQASGMSATSYQELIDAGYLEPFEVSEENARYFLDNVTQ
ncbi:uncharacterized protein KQ657_001852 [Scheffersomyces spartinae]|uniref:Flavin-containing monooxygenase n=1 Tax=Scheffersomyces spartinae TaxID=45513 RepID=A0A9P7V758_9ASCO|nr:uncharacterized protein KQ657_001852 [Scheffersomyces spartinae]KAG7192451.1 hypothetical protein KQ657_001852 [Scheffersomyces spartinae]